MINWNEINLKGRVKGQIKTTCPTCSPIRTKKDDPCLSVNLDKGVANCHHCGDVSFKESKESNIKYNYPSQEWQNHTNLSDNLVKWFKERGISQDTLIANKITEEESYFPQVGKTRNAIVFNYFEGKNLVNKKYRDGKKNFTQVKGAKKLFYGVNDIINEDTCYVVEGEMDKLAMWEAGYKNCVSVPNGAKDLNDIFQTCEYFLKNIETFYIAVDMDEAGRELENNLAKRLGKNNCKRVLFKNGKDANDELLNGNLDECISEAQPYPIEGTFTANDIADDFDRLYREGLARPLKIGNKDWEDWDESFAPLRGQLTVVTGIPGSGKSNWLEWYVLNLMKVHSLRTSFYSPEHLPMEVHHAALSEKVIGKPFYGATYDAERMTPHERRLYSEWSSDKLFLTTPENGLIPDWDWIFERFKEQMFRYNIDIFVIDAFNKIKRKNSDSIGEISEILARLTLFAQTHEALVFLVAHPRKMNKGNDGLFEIPTLYDIKGSSEFYDQPHNGICVHRYYGENYTKVIPQKIKFKHQGVANKEVLFQYCVPNGRYYPFNGRKDFLSMIEDKTNANLLIGNDKFFE